MTAHTKIKPAPKLGATADRSRYLPAVDCFMPGCDEQERQYRASLMLIRDNSLSAMRRVNADAYDVLEIVNRITSVYCLMPMSIERLAHLREQMVKLVTISNALNAFNQDEGAHADD